MILCISRVLSFNMYVQGLTLSAHGGGFTSGPRKQAHCINENINIPSYSEECNRHEDQALSWARLYRSMEMGSQIMIKMLNVK